jgi:hypothetical protein
VRAFLRVVLWPAFVLVFVCAAAMLLTSGWMRFVFLVAEMVAAVVHLAACAAQIVESRRAMREARGRYFS